MDPAHEGNTATKVGHALMVASICNLAVSHDLRAPQQEVSVTIPLWLQCRDYWSVMVGCVYKKSLLPMFPAQIYCFRLVPKLTRRRSVRFLHTPEISFINYGSEEEMKNMKNSLFPCLPVLYLYLEIHVSSNLLPQRSPDSLLSASSW